MPARILDDVETAQLLADYENGVSTKEIAKKLFINRRSVYHYIRRNGGRSRAEKTAQIMADAKTMGPTEIAKKYRLSVSTIGYYLYRRSKHA